jgi:hypothetical protein
MDSLALAHTSSSACSAILGVAYLAEEVNLADVSFVEPGLANPTPEIPARKRM